MAFCLLNKTRTWLEIEIGDKTVIINPGETSGLFEKDDITGDVRQKIANGSLVLVAAITTSTHRSVDPVMYVDLDSSQPDDSSPDPQSNNEDKDEE